MLKMSSTNLAKNSLPSAASFARDDRLAGADDFREVEPVGNQLRAAVQEQAAHEGWLGRNEKGRDVWRQLISGALAIE